jgi:DNA-binding response OmpR family regulator
VEDEPLFRMLMVDMLEDAGFHILEAESGANASARPDLPNSRSVPRPYRYLAKPFSMEQFSAAVDELLASSKGSH